MFLDTSEFPFTALLESRWTVIRHEFRQLAPQQLMPWPETDLYDGAWDVFGLWALGKRLEENCRLCPETASTVESIAGITTAGFSRLAPGTRIVPHCGYTNTVWRCHLGLIVPADCGLRVGEETRHWQEGKCLVFDDTLMHGAWNDSRLPRIVLLVDFVRPGSVFEVTASALQTIESLTGNADT